MKKAVLLGLLAAAVLLLAGCQQQAALPAQTPTATVAVQKSPLEITSPTDVPAIPGVPEGYNPSSEEDSQSRIADTEFDVSGVPVFAGATPIPLDPVDMPSAPPRQALAFTYATYTATKLGLTFESVAGYTVDDSQQETYVLTEPIEQKKDNYSVQFTFTISPAGANYTVNNLKADIRAFAADLGKVNYRQWRVSETAERTLMGKPGYYVTYRGEMHDGTIVRGRVHMALLDNRRILTIHYTGPGEYNSDYTDVFHRIRSTLKAI